MTPAGIAAKVAFGYGKAASKLGPIHTQYRPTTPTTPALAPQNIMAQLAFIASPTADAAFKRPNVYEKPLRYGLFDPTTVLAGDYIDGPSGTFFVASEFALEIPMVVVCNSVLSLLRAAGTSASSGGFGATSRSGTGGTQRTNKTIALNQWPGSLLQGTKGEANPSQLPDDVRAPWCIILLPAIDGLTIETTDQIEDDLGRVWTVSSVELGPLGYRLTAAYAET